MENKEELAATSHAVHVCEVRIGANDRADALPFMQTGVCLLYRVSGYGAKQMLHTVFLCPEAKGKPSL